MSGIYRYRLIQRLLTKSIIEYRMKKGYSVLLIGVSVIKNLIDTHIHTKFSFDGKAKMEEMCQCAITKGLTEICFTEHFSVNNYDPSYEVLDYQKYAEEIERCIGLFGERITIRKGLEIGETHIKNDVIKSFLMRKDLDYIIGSVHNIGIKKLRKHIRGKQKNESYEDYFEELYKSVKFGDMDALGHFDLMKRYAFDVFGNYDMEVYYDLISSIFDVMINRNIALEINTSGLISSAKEIFPSIDVLKLYRSKGGEMITVGSDAHRPDMLGNGIEDIFKLLKNMGYTSILSYRKRIPLLKSI
ncbi:MAG TPA: histidinol-phosphatase [Eubacteriaceae bacterium]|nr:histidinol-phosphatase [Eubacteriaceae bacterium]